MKAAARALRDSTTIDTSTEPIDSPVTTESHTHPERVNDDPEQGRELPVPGRELPEPVIDDEQGRERTPDSPLVLSRITTPVPGTPSPPEQGRELPVPGRELPEPVIDD